MTAQRINTIWRIWQAIGVSMFLAVGFYLSNAPIGDPCGPCNRGELPWFICWLGGCF